MSATEQGYIIFPLFYPEWLWVGERGAKLAVQLAYRRRSGLRRGTAGHGFMGGGIGGLAEWLLHRS